MFGTLASFFVGSKVEIGRGEEPLAGGEMAVEAVEGGDEVAGRLEAVDALLGRRAVGLTAQGLELEPEDALLGDLDHRAVLVARVRDHDQVLLAEGLGVLEDVADALAAARLLVRDQGQPDVVGRADALGPEGLDGEEGGDHVLLVVLDAAAVDPALLDPGLVRVALPEGDLARRDDVHVGHDPVRPGRAPALEGGQEVRPVPRRGVEVRGLDERDVLEPVLLQEARQELGLGRLALPAAPRGDGRDRRQADLQVDHLVPVLSDPAGDPLELIGVGHDSPPVVQSSAGILARTPEKGNERISGDGPAVNSRPASSRGRNERCPG